MGEAAASGGASWGTGGAAGGAATLDEPLSPGGSARAPPSAGGAAGGSGCAAAPFAAEPLIRRISAAPCGNSGVPSATAVSAAPATSKTGKIKKILEDYTFKPCFCKSNTYPIAAHLPDSQQVLVTGPDHFPAGTDELTLSCPKESLSNTTNTLLNNYCAEHPALTQP